MFIIQTKRLLSFPQFRFLTTTTTLPQYQSYTLQFLTNSCGFPSEAALTASLNLQLDETNSKNHESILNFLKSRGFSITHIATLINKRPKIFNSDFDKTIKPKIDFFFQNGFTGSVLADMIIANHSILGRSLDLNLQPGYAFLKKYLQTDDRVISAVKRGALFFSSSLKNTMQPNVDILISEGVPISHISKFMLARPITLKGKVDRTVEIIKTVRELGLHPPTTKFIRAVEAMMSMSESSWKKKVDVFKSLGWSDEEINVAFKNEPFIFRCSKEKIRSGVEFLLQAFKLESSVIASNSKILLYGLERSRLRCEVLKLLVSKKLIKKDIKFTSTIKLSETMFMKQYVTKHLDDVPDLMKIYCGTSTSKAS